MVRNLRRLRMELWLLFGTLMYSRALNLAGKLEDIETVERIAAAMLDMMPADELPTCTRCGLPWQDHYEPTLLQYKNGPNGTFGLRPGMHGPHIKGIHKPLRDSDG